MRGDLVGRVAIGAVADHRIGARDRHVGERQAIDVDADAVEIAGDQPRAQAGGRKPACAIAFVERAVGRAGRIGRPVRRAEPLHPAALLVDQDRRIGRHRRAEIVHQAANLLGIDRCCA